MERRQPKHWQLIQEIKDIDEIDVIIWALTGAKRCSMFPEKENYGPRAIPKNVIMRTLQILGLEYKNWAVQIKGWPSWEEFFKKYQSPNDQTGDLAAGLYYDIPYCCAKFFHERHKSRIEQLLANISFGQNPDELIQKQEKDPFFDQVTKETVALISANKLPPALFLLMGRAYVPCHPFCGNFIQQAKKMFEALRIYLGRKRAIEIISAYKKRV